MKETIRKEGEEAISQVLQDDKGVGKSKKTKQYKKAAKQKLKEQGKQIDAHSDITENSIKTMKEIFQTLDYHFRSYKKEDSNSIPIKSINNDYLQKIYENKKEKKIKDTITATALEATLTAYHQFIKEYSQQILKTLHHKLPQKKTIEDCTIDEVRKFEKRVKIGDIWEEKQINPENIDFRVFGKTITKDEVLDYMKTILNIDYTPTQTTSQKQQESQQKRKKNQKIENILQEQRKLPITLNTCPKIGESEQQAKERHKKYFSNTNITLEDFTNYLQAKQKKLEKAEQERLKRDEETVKESCNRWTKEISTNLKEIWKDSKKLLKRQTKQIQYEKDLLCNLEFTQRLETKLFEERKKDQKPQESQREKNLKEAIYNKICGKFKTPLILQRNGEYREIPFYNIKILCRLTENGNISVIKILPKEPMKLTIKKGN